MKTEELKTDHEILKYFADPKKWIKDYEVSAVSRKDSMVLQLIKLASK